MNDEIGSFAGCLLVVIIAAWAAAFLSRQFFRNIRDGKVVDQTLSEFDASDRPGMAILQAIGFVLAIVGSLLVALIVILKVIESG